MGSNEAQVSQLPHTAALSRLCPHRSPLRILTMCFCHFLTHGSHIKYSREIPPSNVHGYLALCYLRESGSSHVFQCTRCYTCHSSPSTASHSRWGYSNVSLSTTASRQYSICYRQHCSQPIASLLADALLQVDSLVQFCMGRLVAVSDGALYHGYAIYTCSPVLASQSPLFHGLRPRPRP